MTLNYLLAVFHLVGLAVGMGAIWTRARALGDVPAQGKPAVARALAADNFWGIAAILFFGTGIPRAFFGFEKGWGYYSGNWIFWTKMGFLVVNLALEMIPMTALIRWRITMQKGGGPDFSRAPLYSRISYIQTGVTLVMVFLAAAMARGLGN